MVGAKLIDMKPEEILVLKTHRSADFVRESFRRSKCLVMILRILSYTILSVHAPAASILRHAFRSSCSRLQREF